MPGGGGVKEEVPLSMTLGNWELMHEHFQNTHAWEQQEWNKTKRQTNLGRVRKVDGEILSVTIYSNLFPSGHYNQFNHCS